MIIYHNPMLKSRVITKKYNEKNEDIIVEN